MIPALLAQIGLPLLVRAVTEGLGRIDHPAAQAASGALKDVDRAMEAGAVPPDAVAEANRHLERMAELESAEARTTLAEVNRSLRTEAVSDDAYVRRMRPTFGYVMALSWSAQMGALAWVIVTEPAQAGAVINAMASLGTIWTVGLSVLGIYVYKRSEEKKGGGTPAAGGTATGEGLLATLARRLGGAG
ncbi:MAG TPA: 3TM-type holin [Azospirillum sp.]